MTDNERFLISGGTAQTKINYIMSRPETKDYIARIDRVDGVSWIGIGLTPFLAIEGALQAPIRTITPCTSPQT